MSHTIRKGWLFTDFSCENAKLSELGVDSQSWLPAAIKMDEIIAFKVYRGIEQDKPDPEEGKVIVYTKDSFFYLNIDFDEFTKIFMEGVK